MESSKTKSEKYFQERLAKSTLKMNEGVERNVIGQNLILFVPQIKKL